jgi:hypothetical protein
MEITNFKRKWVCVLLISAIMLQSCAVYKKDAVTLDGAVNANCKVELIRSDSTTLYLKKIEKIDGNYIGITEYLGKKIKVPLTESNIKTIHLLNKSATTWGNIGIAFGSVVFIIGIIGVIVFIDSLESGV